MNTEVVLGLGELFLYWAFLYLMMSPKVIPWKLLDTINKWVSEHG